MCRVRLCFAFPFLIIYTTGFTESGLQRDFSLLATVRIKQGSRPVLLALYDANGSERLALRLGTDALLAYQDKNKRPPPQRFPLFPAVNIADGRYAVHLLNDLNFFIYLI